MLNRDSLSINWIEKTAKANRNADIILVEKAIRALYLLELLQASGLSFIFKGGTALMLLLQETKRLSIDIDIIVHKKPDTINKNFEFVVAQSDFISFEADHRTANSKIDKDHIKFYYKPVVTTKTGKEYILLDILYEQSPYLSYLTKHPISSPFILTEEEPIQVTIPWLEALLGDKMTAFAPNTTGVPYRRGKEIEIIKQLYDIGNLFDNISTMRPVSEVFHTVATAEIGYRSLGNTPLDVLEDIYGTSLLIATRGQDGKGDFIELQRGIQNIRNYIFSESFHIERAMVFAAKAAYLAALIKTGAEFTRYIEPNEIADWKIEQPFNTKLNKLKKSNPEAFFYWYHAIRLKS